MRQAKNTHSNCNFWMIPMDLVVDKIIVWMNAISGLIFH